MTNAYSPAIYTWGPRNGPQTPRRSDRPGLAVAVLYFRLTAGGPEMAPNPHHSAAPAKPWRSSISGLLLGAPRWPPNPHHSGRPGEAVARLPQPPNVRAAPAEPWR